MVIRKIQYNINYSHILTFKDDYKNISSPYFGWNKVKYSVEQMNTIHESLRLIFTEYNCIIHLRKDGITIMFEGDEEMFMTDAGLLKEFFVMYNNITELECYGKTIRHDFIVYSVDVSNPINNTDYLKFNPIKAELTEFACVYTYNFKNYNINFTFGDFIPNDISRYELSPFSAEQNIDLVSADGSIIETLNYSKCEFTAYFVYSNDSRGKYRFSDSLPEKMELRDITKFNCLGFSLST